MEANNKFEWRFLQTEEELLMIQQWWKEWGFPIPERHQLSKNAIILSKENVDVYAGFIYYTGTSMAWVEFVVSNKSAPIELKRGALERLMDIISILAKEKGVLSLFTSTNNEAYKNSLLKAGFTVGDVNTYQLIKQT